MATDRLYQRIAVEPKKKKILRMAVIDRVLEFREALECADPGAVF